MAGSMDLQRFKASLAQDEPPSALGSALKALWWDAKGDWEKAHEHAQADEGKAAAWVHALLHRREGDLANAGYWYRRAGQPVASGSLDEEWRSIAGALLTQA